MKKEEFSGGMVTREEIGKGRSNRGKRKKGRKQRILEKILKEFENKVSKGGVNVTVGDVLKVIQLEQEQAGEETPTEIRVRWVEPEE